MRAGIYIAQPAHEVRPLHHAGGPKDLMRPLLSLARAFINTFGITDPGPQGIERAARFIGLLLLLVVILVGLVAVVLHRAFHAA